MTSDLILLFLSVNPDSTFNEMTKCMRINVGSAYSTVGNLKKSGNIVSTSERPRRYSLTKEFTAKSEVYDEYVHRVIAAGASTVESVVKVSGLSSYRVALSIRRLKNLNKISTITGMGITLNELPVDLKLKPWTTKEMQTLEDLAGRVPISEICETLGRTRNSIQMKCHLLGLSLVTHTCRKGHRMVERKTGKWVCNECHSQAERLRRVVNKA